MNVSFQKKLIGGDIVGTSNSDRNLVYDKTLFENDHIKKTTCMWSRMKFFYSNNVSFSLAGVRSFDDGMTSGYPI